MKPEILVVTPIYAPTLAALEREFTVHKLWHASDLKAFLEAVAPNVRGVVTTGIAGVGRQHIDALPRLEIIGCIGNPRGTVDLATARARAIAVTNTPDSIAASVADLAVGLLIAVARRLCECDRFVRAGKWADAAPPAGRDLGGKTCGIIGLGSIGANIARRAEAFGMAVCYHGPREKRDVPYRYYADLAAMARNCDCLMVTCPATDATRNLVDARILDALGPDGLIVNVARGSIVEESALIAALKEKRIAGAGLDVYRDEPRVSAELVGFDNVVLTPHIGSTTREIREERGAKLIANLRAHFSGHAVLNPVPG